jgi:hypothetical protein
LWTASEVSRLATPNSDRDERGLRRVRFTARASSGPGSIHGIAIRS